MHRKSLPCFGLFEVVLSPGIIAGVHDAIKRMYLKRLYFGISGNAEGTQLLEVRKTLSGESSISWAAHDV